MTPDDRFCKFLLKDIAVFVKHGKAVEDLRKILKERNDVGMESKNKQTKTR